MVNFKIQILNQHWISTDDNGNDLCSHGEFELIIGGEIILCKHDKIDWTISTSTLNLLKCIESNYIAEQNFELILHCGQLQMLSCPIGVYINIIHRNEKVKIENIKKQFGVSDNEFIDYPNLKVEIPKNHFAMQILKIAEQVKLFFENQPKRVLNDKEDELLWKNFWLEFNTLYDDGVKKYYF